MLRQRVSVSDWAHFCASLSQINNFQQDLLHVDGVVYYGVGLGSRGSEALSSAFRSGVSDRASEDQDLSWLSPENELEDEPVVHKETPQLRAKLVETPLPHMIIECSSAEASFLDLWRMFIIQAKKAGLKV